MPRSRTLGHTTWPVAFAPMANGRGVSGTGQGAPGRDQPALRLICPRCGSAFEVPAPSEMPGQLVLDDEIVVSSIASCGHCPEPRS